MKKTVLTQEQLSQLAVLAQAGGEQPPEVTPEVTPEVVAETVDFTAQLAEKDAKIEELAGQIDGAKAALAETQANFEAKVTAAEAQVTALKGIVAGQVKSMRMALSLAAVDIEAMSAEEVIREYHAASKTFMETLPVGGVVPKEEEVKVVKAIESSHDEANFRSLGFN